MNDFNLLNWRPLILLVVLGIIISCIVSFSVSAGLLVLLLRPNGPLDNPPPRVERPVENPGPVVTVVVVLPTNPPSSTPVPTRTPSPIPPTATPNPPTNTPLPTATATPVPPTATSSPTMPPTVTLTLAPPTEVLTAPVTQAEALTPTTTLAEAPTNVASPTAEQPQEAPTDTLTPVPDTPTWTPVPPTPTATPLPPTATFTPTPLPPTPTFTPTTVPTFTTYATVNGFLNLRAGPGVASPILTTLRAGTRLGVMGRTPTGWLHVRTPDGKIGWVSGNYVTLEGPTPPLVTPTPTPGPHEEEPTATPVPPTATPVPPTATYTPVPPPTATVQPVSLAPSPTALPPPTSTGGVTRGSIIALMNMRSAPSIEADIVETLPPRLEIEVLGQTTNGWLQARTPAGNEGWVLKTFVALLGPPPPLVTITPTVSAPVTQTPTPTITPGTPVVREITEAQMTTALEAYFNGADIMTTNLQVDFRDGLMFVTADRLEGLIITMTGFQIAGEIVAEGGQLHFQVDTSATSIPLTTIIAPRFDSILSGFAAGMYVTEARVTDDTLFIVGQQLGQ